MKIFILEDDPNRILMFRERLMEHDLTVATGVVEAVEKFAPPYDLYLLDHDLGGQVYLDNGDFNTGNTFLRQVMVWRALQKALVVVHSYNRVGAEEMERAATEAGATAIRIPFGPALFTVVERVVQLLAEGKTFEKEERV